VVDLHTHRAIHPHQPRLLAGPQAGLACRKPLRAATPPCQEGAGVVGAGAWSQGAAGGAGAAVLVIPSPSSLDMVAISSRSSVPEPSSSTRANSSASPCGSLRGRMGCIVMIAAPA
jgi:hypothetical protein